MNRKYLTRLLVCLIPCALAGVFVVDAFKKEARSDAGFRRGIDLAGGTILVYEVNLERTNARKLQGGEKVDPNAQSDGLSSEDIRKLAENLKRRIDPNDLRNVVVRPVGTTRVEIILPFSGSTSGGKEAATEDFVQEVKALVRQVGVLEFRILANSTDDEAGVRDAEAAINAADADPKLKETLLTRAKAGLPPPSPTGDYTVTVNGSEQANVTYEWTELGKEERDTLRLSNKYSADSPLWQKLAANRGRAVREGSLLFYSREFAKQVQTKDEDGKKIEYFLLTRVSPSDALKVDRDVGLTASADTDPKTLNPCVSFRFNSTGANRFGKMTERNKPSGPMFRNLAIVMDDKIVSAPTLNAVIRDSGQISGGSFDMAGVNRLVHILRSGALNAELKPEPVSENTVGPTLGQDTITRGITAVGASFAAVMVFMVVYYRFSGLVACIALLANLLLTVGFMVAVQAAFTLPGLAGIVLMLGMAVDANVLIYERIREERAKGANLATAIRLGYDRAFGTIIDTHLTSIFTALVLYVLGNDNLKGFAVSLTVGLIISLFTALYMTRLMFDYALDKKYISELRMHQLFPRPNFNFMAVRYQMLTLTAILTVLGLGLFLARGEAALNVDFTKGTAYGGRLRDGEERALRTAGGKPGMLDLLDESRQKDKLQVKEVVWLTKPDADPEKGSAPKPAEYVYKIIYNDNSEAVVTFANAPDGVTEAEKTANVKERAGHLPDYSVEQVFLSGKSFSDGKSQLFTIRTTEKEPDLVQVILDRLLRDEAGQPLLDTTKLTGITFNGPTATVTFDKPTSPRYVKEFVTRELMLKNRIPAQGSAPAVDVTGVATGDAATIQDEGTTGKYRTLLVSVANNPEFKPLKDAADKLKADADKAKADAEKAKLAAEKGGLMGAIAGAFASAPPEAPAPAGPVDPKATEDARVFKLALESAVTAFSARPLPDRLETFDPALAADTRTRAFFAIMASWLAILAFLWFRFGSWTFGLAAVLCLIHDLCFTLGAIAACHYLHDTTFGAIFRLSDFKIDLAAVAALLTLVGYSVNDTIVVFDRIREVRGKNVLLTPQMINDSVNQTLSRTVLASLTVFLVVGVLYLFGGDGVHLFSFVMVIGVLVGTYSSIYIASPLLLIFGEGHVHPNERKPTTPEPVATVG